MKILQKKFFRSRTWSALCSAMIFAILYISFPPLVTILQVILFISLSCYLIGNFLTTWTYINIPYAISEQYITLTGNKVVFNSSKPFSTAVILISILNYSILSFYGQIFLSAYYLIVAIYGFTITSLIHKASYPNDKWYQLFTW